MSLLEALDKLFREQEIKIKEQAAVIDSQRATLATQERVCAEYRHRTERVERDRQMPWTLSTLFSDTDTVAERAPGPNYGDRR